MLERDSCGERGCGSGEVAGDAGDNGAGDCEVEKGEGGARGGEGEEQEDDWISAELIGGEIAFEWAGVVLDVDVDVDGVWGGKSRTYFRPGTILIG